MDIITTIVAVYFLTLLINSILTLIAIILGIRERMNPQQPVTSVDGRSTIFYVFKHSAAFRILVRICSFLIFVFHIPMFALVMFPSLMKGVFTAIAFSWMITFFISISIYICTFSIGAVPRILYYEVDDKGLKVTFKKKQTMYIPIECYRGYSKEQDMLLFYEQGKGKFKVPVKFLKGNDHIAFIAKIQEIVEHQMRNKTEVTERETIKAGSESAVLEAKENAVEEKDTSVALSSLAVDMKSSGIIDVQAPVNDDPFGLKERSVGIDNSIKEDDLSPSSYIAPDISVSVSGKDKIRIFIKNTYRYDLQSKINEYIATREATDVAMTCDSYPGSSWMYIDIDVLSSDNGDIVFAKALDILIFMGSLNKDMLLYIEGGQERLIFPDPVDLSGKQLFCISRGGKYKISDISRELELCEEDEIYSDIRKYIKENYSLDL